MSRAVIEVRNLSKRYRLGAIGATSLREEVARTWDRVRGIPSREVRDFWALRDVSFEVRPGEVVGIVGRNGAGKSTLLKILSRITEPTSGVAKLRGRVASLLEIGTGFHPELTGRENLYLNGALLGMTRAEVRAKFDEIVAFAEVEQFIDTPVKRYSSGMYVRLAFAVAAHLDPEILLVDEVLAVGDAQFQKKCLGKMSDVATSEGRTVLFVSHNVAALNTLCSWSLLLREGMLVALGETAAIVSAYLGGSLTKTVAEWPEPATAPGNEHIRLAAVRVAPRAGEAILSVDTGATLEVVFLNQRAGINLDCTVYVVTGSGVVLFESGCVVSRAVDSRVGRYRVWTTLPPHLLNAGRYTVNLVFGQDQYYVLFRADDVIAFDVENTATGRGANLRVAPGVIRPLLPWQHEFLSE